MAELKRFIHTSSAAWKGVENKAAYNNSIVFIHDGDKGVSIYTQGATFDTELTAAEVEPMVKAYLKEGQNVTITEKDGKLVIAAPGTATITAKSTELVQAGAVAGALTTPMSLSLAVADNKGTFSQNFKNLEGKNVTAASAVIAGGDNITLTQTDDGLKIDAKDTTYTAGTGLTLNGTVFNHTNKVEAVTAQGAQLDEEILSDSNRSFEVKAYAYDAEGHITGSVDNKITLPAEAFSDTTYEVTMTAGNSNEVSLNTKKDGQAENTYTIKGDKGTTVSFENGVMTISSDTADTILSGLDVTDAAAENQYVSEVDQTNGLISVTRTTLPVYGVSDTKVDGLKLSLTDGKVGLVDDGLAADLTSKNITLETAETATAGYLKTYVLKQGTTEIGKIDLPKELVVTGGSVVEKEDGEKYLRLIIANQDTPVDIAVKDLVDVYTAGNGIAISDANVVSAKVKEEDPYLKLGAEGLYTDGIDTAISNAINALDVTGSTIGSKATGTDTVNVIDSLTWSETDGKVSISGTTTSAATKTYVDNAIAALDVASTTTGTKNANDEGNTVTVIDQITYSETDGKVSISASTTTAATKAYVDSKAAAATTKVVKSTDTESVKYLDITPTTETNGPTTYTVKVSGVDKAISDAIGGLDSNINVDATPVITDNNAHDGKVYESIEIVDGKLVQGENTQTRIKYIDNAKLTNLDTTKIKYTGVSKTDTISQAIEKIDAAWEWGTI